MEELETRQKRLRRKEKGIKEGHGKEQTKEDERENCSN